MLLFVLALRAVANCDEPEPLSDDFKAMTADCGKMSGKFRAPMERGMAAGKVSAHASMASGFADQAATDASDAADHANDAAAAARAVGGTLPEGAADDAEAAATEASDASTAATDASIEASNAIGAVDAKIPTDAASVTGEEITTAKAAVEAAMEAGHEAKAKAKIAHEQATKAEEHAAKAASAAGDAATAVASDVRKAKVDADKAVKRADGAGDTADSQAAYGSKVAAGISGKFDLDADPVMKAVVTNLEDDVDTATEMSQEAYNKADAVESAWSTAESVSSGLMSSVGAMDASSVSADDVGATEDALDAVAIAIAEAEKAADDAKYAADKVYERAKADEAKHAPGSGSFLAQKRVVRKA